MTRSTVLLLLLAAGAPLAACMGAGTPAVPAQGRARECFLARQVNSFANATDTSVDVKVGANRYYRLALLGTCHDIDWSTNLILRTTGGSSWICEGYDAEIIVPRQIGGRCLVTDMRPISREMWRARSKS